MTTVISTCICLSVSTSTEQGVRPMQMYGTGSSEVRAQNLDRYWCGMKVIQEGRFLIFPISHGIWLTDLLPGSSTFLMISTQ